MYAKTLLHSLCEKALPQVHKKRLNAVINASMALVRGKKLTLSQLGRNMEGKAQERHNIRKVDRLLGNQKLYADRLEFYKMKATRLLLGVNTVVISVDWSATDKRKDFHILRASLSLQGRGEAIYEEVHAQEHLNSRAKHDKFLERLKYVLPEGIEVILLTDAGFCNPWFKKAVSLGFDFIGRTKSNIHYQLNGERGWKPCSSLYEEATEKAKWFEDCLLTKGNRINCNIVLYKEKIKGRVRKTPIFTSPLTARIIPKQFLINRDSAYSMLQILFKNNGLRYPSQFLLAKLLDN